MVKKNKLATSVKPLSLEEAQAVNGGQQVFGLIVNPNNNGGGSSGGTTTHHKHHKHHKPIFGLMVNPNP